MLVKSSRASFVVAVLGVSAFAACGGSSSSTTTTGPRVASGGQSGSATAGGASATAGNRAGGSAGESGASAAGGSASFTCTPACAAPQHCGTSTGTCLDAGKCGIDTDCPDGEQCDSKGACKPGSMCGVLSVGATPTVPNLVVTLDRSCSMTDNDSSKQPKWASAVGAIEAMITGHATTVQFGLVLFPDKTGDKCTQDGPTAVTCDADGGAKITTLLSSALKKGDTWYPNDPCATPIDAGLMQASEEAALSDKDHPGYVVLITDGEQSTNCKVGGGDAGSVKTIKAMEKAGVDTFVVSFGDGTGIDKTQLNAFADAGGKPSTAVAGESYYRASDEASLATLLDSLLAETLTCDYKLAIAPASVDDIYVFFDNSDQILQDTTHKDGWDYDAAKQTVTFYGADCDDLKDGKTKSLEIVFGCPGGSTTEPAGSGGSGGASGNGAGGGPSAGCDAGEQSCDSTHLCPAGYACASNCCGISIKLLIGAVQALDGGRGAAADYAVDHR